MVTSNINKAYRVKITKKIIEALKNGTAPWQKPWEGDYMPINATTGGLSSKLCMRFFLGHFRLPKSFRLMEKWGFRYITCLTWIKPHYGVGNYFRGQTEHVLFGVKGQQPLKRHDVGTWFEAPRGERHSAKPDEFYALVESCSYAPYIDICRSSFLLIILMSGLKAKLRPLSLKNGLKILLTLICAKLKISLGALISENFYAVLLMGIFQR